MKVYRAETGKRLGVRGSIDSLDSLKVELERVSGIPVSSQILMTSYGMQLEPNVIAEAVLATGKDEYIIFLFNRELLDATNTKSIESLNENPLMETPVIASAAGTSPATIQKHTSWRNLNLTDECGAFVNMFQTHHSQGQSYVRSSKVHVEICERFYQEQKMQAKALNVALTNLHSHSCSIVETFEEFSSFAVEEIGKNKNLAKSISENIKTLQNITIHPEILQLSDVSRKKDLHTLADFITENTYVTLANQGSIVYDQLTKRLHELAQNVHSVQSDTDALRKKKFDSNFPSVENSLTRIHAYLDKIKHYSEKIERDVGRVQAKVSNLLEPSSGSPVDSTTATKTIEAFEHLSSTHANEYLPDMEKLDQHIRAQVNFFTQCKNTMTATLISSLQQISHLESSINGIPSTLSQLETDIRFYAQEFKQLYKVPQIPLAYAMTIVEIMRRKEYDKLLREESHKIAEIMARFRDLEQDRRDFYRREAKHILPFTVPALDDNPPICEISTPNIRDDRLPTISKDDLQGISNLVMQFNIPSPKRFSLYQSPTADKSLRIKAADEPFSALQTAYLKFSGLVDGMSIEFLRLIDKSFFAERNTNISSLRTSTHVPSSPQTEIRSKRTSRKSFSEDARDYNFDLVLIEKNSQLERAEEKIKAYEARIKNLENLLHTNYQASKNNASLSASRPDLSIQKSLTAAEQELANLRTLYQNLKILHDETLKENVSLEERASDIEAHYREMESQYSNLIKEKSEYERKIADMEMRFREMETATRIEKDMQERNDNITKDKDMLEQKVKDMEAAHANIIKEKEVLLRRIDESEIKYRDIEAERNDLVKEKDTQTKRVNDLESRSHDLEVSLTEAHKDKQAFENRYLSAMRENDAIKEHRCELENLVVKANDDQKLEHSKVKSLMAEVDNLQALINELTPKYQETVREKEQIQVSYEREILELKSQMNTLESEKILALKSSDEQYEESQRHLDTIKKEKEELENEYANYQRLAIQERETQQQELLELGTEIQTLKNKNSELGEKKMEKLVKDIDSLLREYLKEVLDSDEHNKDPIQMVKILGEMVTNSGKELRDLHKSLEDSKKTCEILVNEAMSLRNDLAERTECARSLSKRLWDFYSHIRTLMSAMQVAMPLISNTNIGQVEDGRVKSPEPGLSDSYLAEDLGQFFAKNIDKESWPKEHYENLITLATKVDLAAVRELVRRSPIDAENMTKKYKKESKSYREKYLKAYHEAKDKIAFHNFKTGDLALFLPTRNNSTEKPWAAFNINFPHYFLRADEAINNQLRNREWIVWRITGITEHIVDVSVSDSNPYDLPDGVKFFLLDVENSQPSIYMVQRSQPGSIPSTSRPRSKQSMSASLSSLPAMNKDASTDSNPDYRVTKK